jgi:GntR family transcriptional regulator
MKFEIDLTNHTPIYLQIMSQVMHAVASGELAPGEQLPTVRQLAADLRVNFNTVARAYRQLDEEGIISTQHGRGTFILEPASRQDSARLRKQDLALLAEYFVEEARKLDVSPDEVRQQFEAQLTQWANEAANEKSQGD